MKAKVYVNLKSGVLDPQGKAIQHSVELLGFTGIADVRQGKYFEIDLAEGLSETEVRAELDRISHEVLSNPVIEDFRVELKPRSLGSSSFRGRTAITMPTTSSAK